jgi:hypothetical protein
MLESKMTIRVLLSFFIALGIIYFTAAMLGKERKAAWFKKRENSNIFTRRGFLGEACNFGVPRKWQGVVVSFWLFCSIGLVGYLLIFSLQYMPE